MSVSTTHPPAVTSLPDILTEFATDIADVYPNKEVTLVHSRDQLLPGFDKWMHDTSTVLHRSTACSVAHAFNVSVSNRLREMNVRLLLNTRIDLNSLEVPSFSPFPCSTPTSESSCTPNLSPTLSASDLSESPCPTPPPLSPRLPSSALPPHAFQTEDSRATISTTDGRKINADLIVRPPWLFINSCLTPPQLFCTGQTHNTSFLKMLSPESINHKSGSAAYVMPSLQLGIKVDDGDVRLSDHPHIFVVGDAADAFGARKSGSAAWYQVSGHFTILMASLFMSFCRPTMPLGISSD